MYTRFFWPSRHTRAAACLSFAGFQSGSNSTSRLPPIRFNPQPPAFDESRKQKRPERGSLNSSTILVRFLIEHEPSSLQHFHPCWWHSRSNRSSVVV